MEFRTGIVPQFDGFVSVTARKNWRAQTVLILPLSVVYLMSSLDDVPIHCFYYYSFTRFSTSTQLLFSRYSAAQRRLFHSFIKLILVTGFEPVVFDSDYSTRAQVFSSSLPIATSTRIKNWRRETASNRRCRGCSPVPSLGYPTHRNCFSLSFFYQIRFARTTLNRRPEDNRPRLLFRQH